MKLSKLILSVFFLFFVNVQLLVAQQTKTKKEVEYNEENDILEDLNSVKVITRKEVGVKKTSEVVNENPIISDDVTMEELQKMVRKRLNTRFHKNRTSRKKKCYRESEEKCSSVK